MEIENEYCLFKLNLIKNGHPHTVKKILHQVAEISLRLLPKRHRSRIKATGREVLEFSSAVLQSSLVARGLLFGKRIVDHSGVANSANSSVQDVSNASKPLESYFDSHTEGPGIWKWRHYFQIYHRHFSKFIGQEVHIVEIGVYSGGSLGMWRNYFGSKARIYGVDIEEACKSYERDSVKIFIGDQADRKFWRRFKAEVPAIDIVIDDGGHKAHQQIVTLEELLPHLRPGGVYLCEDVHGVFNCFHTYVSGLTHNLNGFDRKPGEKELASFANAFQRIVQAVHLYPFVTVIERSEVAVRQFVAPKHGTEWQPLFWKEQK